jgi:peptide/nickel transport system substrate-binding protein
MLQLVGSYDPESSGGVSTRFRSDQPYTGVRDPRLDELINAAAASADLAERDSLYVKAAMHINENAYGPLLFAFAPAQVAVRGIEGPGLTTKIPPIVINTGVLWQDVRFVAE